MSVMHVYAGKQREPGDVPIPLYQIHVVSRLFDYCRVELGVERSAAYDTVDEVFLCIFGTTRVVAVGP